jgi:HD-like signal output (HDOD) protein
LPMDKDLLSLEKRIKRIQRHISRMPSFSTTVTKVLEICNDPTTSPNDLNRVISLDPVLTGKVLNLINSAYYALPNQITSLTRAIIMIGINTVKNLALSTAILDSIGQEKGSFQAFSMDDFWTHSICVGVTAKLLAGIKGVSVAEREEYFVAGLIHDLGKIPLNNCFDHEYDLALELSVKREVSLLKTEAEVFDMDHSIVGGMIADKWQLNSSMKSAMCHHHKPEKAGDENKQLVGIVTIANTYANIFNIGSSGDAFPENQQTFDLMEQMEIDRETLSDLKQTIIEEIEKAKIFLTNTK